jgi:hypothetical protein
MTSRAGLCLPTRLWLGLVALALTLGFTLPAFAQVAVQARASATKVEVGQRFQVELTASSSDRSQPSGPRLPVPPGVSVGGPSVGTRTQVSLGMGGMRQETSTTATWVLVASRPGTLKLGPPSIEANGKRFVGPVVMVEVVPEGTLPRAPARGRQGFNPFDWLDPFGQGASPFPPGLGPGADEPQQLPPVPEELRVEEAPDPIAFVRAVATPKRPVVGEQVTLRVYAYGGRGRFGITGLTEPSRADFLSYYLDDRTAAQELERVPIGDTMFLAVKVFDLALFPLRAGKLRIGPVTVTYDGGRYRARTPIVRSSPVIELDVDEPPLRGRPAGYKIGDVGVLTLDATVEPKSVVQGDAIAVTAKLEGSGNLPTTLIVPQKRGVEWLEPTVISNVEPKRGAVGGSRNFTYIVKLSESGNVELGDLTLPYFDPKKRAYAVARAPLGTVSVAPNPQLAAAAAAAASAAPGASKAAFLPRKQLRSFEPPATPFTDDRRFWFLLFGAPVAMTLAGLGLEVGGRLKRRNASHRASPERLAEEALSTAATAADREQVAATATAVERALFLAIEAGTQIRGRGLLRSELGPALITRGVPADLSQRTVELLDACEDARFTGKSGKLAPKALLARARELVSQLSRKRWSRV